MTGMSLVEFLRARLDEDEAAARAAIPALSCEDGDPVWPDYQTYSGDDLTTAYDYLSRFQPARVLAEVEAKRRIIARWEQARDEARTPVSSDHFTRVSIARGELGDVLRDLALPYASHPDHPKFKQEWLV